MMEDRAKILGVALAILFILDIAVWHAVYAETRSVLTVSFLDVGQGDAIFIQAPSGRQVLIDGGPDRSVLRELGAMMPWYDRSIDVVFATHPDVDHVTGLVDVLQRFDVDYIYEPGVAHDTPQTEALLKTVANEEAVYALARRGQVIELGDGAFIEILFPDRDASGFETNSASIVARLVYGKTAFLLTGDAPDSIEKYLVQLDGKALRADVLKAGHHGSRTSSSLLFVGTVSPEYAVYSRGCDNSYGHPHEEVVATFARLEVRTKDTCLGRVTFVSDGQSVRLK